jgi:cell division septation protein DedD
MKHDDDYENDEFDDVELDEEEQYESGILRWLSVIFVVSAIGGFAALAWYAYKSSMEPVSDDEIPYVAAETEPFKEKPEDPGGLQFEHQDKSVYNQLASGNGAQQPMAERLLPPPEEPVERAMPEPVVAEDVQKEPVETITADEGDTKTSAEPLIVEEVTIAPVEAPAEPKVEEKAMPVETVAEVPVAAPVEPKPVGAEPPKPAKQPTIKPEPVAPTQAASKTGEFMAQLGAFSSEEDAIAAWEKVKAAHGSVFPTKKHVLVQANVNGKTYHRLQIGTFDSDTSARKVCEYLQQHKQDCFVVSVK